MIMHWDTNRGPGYLERVKVQFDMYKKTATLKIGTPDDGYNFADQKAVYINGVKFINPKLNKTKRK